MPETEADRILRERLRQREAQGRREQAEKERQARITYQRYFDDINAEINTVLRLLDELKKYGDPELTYPFMQEVRFRKEHNFILFSLFDHSVTKAGWIVGSCEINPGGRGDGGFSVPLYLLSDGRLCCDNSVGSPQKIIGWYERPGSYDSTGCLKGLQDLRRKLEAMKWRKHEEMNK